jgi:O-methyltransferase domain
VFAEPAPGRFALTEASELLRSDHPAGLRRWLDQDGAAGRMDAAWPGLLESVRDGRPGYRSMYGRSFWEDVDADPALRRSYDALLAGPAADLARELATAVDWREVAHVVDVGGGSGALLAGLLEAHPHLRGTLVELASTAETAAAAFEARGLARRSTVRAGSAFDPLPPGGDVYLLSWVLHDWDDAEAVAILRRCADVASDDATVLVIEHVVSADAPSALHTALDLRMLHLVGGRERTAEELAALADAAGLALSEHGRTADGRTILAAHRRTAQRAEPPALAAP